MPSLSDYYTPSSNTALPFTLANNALEGSDATTDAGLAQSRLLRNYGTRQLPDLVNRYSSRGTARSGWAGVMADRLKEDTGNQYGDIQRQLDRTLAGLRRNGVLATTGVTL